MIVAGHGCVDAYGGFGKGTEVEAGAPAELQVIGCEIVIAGAYFSMLSSGIVGCAWSMVDLLFCDLVVVLSALFADSFHLGNTHRRAGSPLFPVAGIALALVDYIFSLILGFGHGYYSKDVIRHSENLQEGIMVTMCYSETIMELWNV